MPGLRFLVVVYAIYKQIKAQNFPVLQDVDEGHFDRAFIALRPGDFPRCM